MEWLLGGMRCCSPGKVFVVSLSLWVGECGVVRTSVVVVKGGRLPAFLPSPAFQRSKRPPGMVWPSPHFLTQLRHVHVDAGTKNNKATQHAQSDKDAGFFLSLL